MRLPRALAALALLAALAPSAAAGDSPWDGLRGSWDSMAGAMRESPDRAHDETREVEEQGVGWTFWTVGTGQQGADNARRQVPGG